MNVLRVQRLVLWDGIDAVFWRRGDGELQGTSRDANPPQVAFPPRAQYQRLQEHAEVIARMVPHLSQPEAIVEVGKHNVRVFYQDGNLLLVFLREGHRSAKSIKRTIHRIFASK